MNAVRLKSVLLMVLAGAIPVAYYAGGVSGFGKGFAAAAFSRSGDARTTVVILRRLRAGDTEAAINMVELELDGLVVENGQRVSRDSFRSSFNLPRLAGVGSTATIDKLASSALVYRAEFPSPAQPPMKALVDDALGQLAKRAHEKD